MTRRFYAFWAINGAFEPERLRRQLEQFRVLGFDGVVWHPRFYPGEPAYLGDRYLAELSEVILQAKSLGLAFWLYDEDGWPSGTVGGELLKRHPDDAQRFANLVEARPERCLAEFVHAGKPWFLEECTGPGVDYLNPDLARHFIGLTHERYRAGLKPAAWAHVEAIFSDEPEFGLGQAFDLLSPHGAVPWTPGLPAHFRERYGEDLLPQIGRLFFHGDGAADTRVKFWELLTDLFNDSYTDPLNRWCREQGKIFTAHVKGEEHPLFQVPLHGSSHQFYRRVDLPGIDALERRPGNDFYPRQLAAAAQQFGCGRCLAEAFGGAGWGATPADLEQYLLWLGGHGVTDFVMHLSQYRLDSAAIQDWPPSQPLHLTWCAAYPEVLRRVRTALQERPRPAADTLVIVPNRGIMAVYEARELLQTNIHNAATYPDSAAGRINRDFLEQVAALHRAGVNYEVADERTVEEFGRVVNERLAIGHREYRRVILPAGSRLNGAAQGLVQPLLGGGVLAEAPLPLKSTIFAAKATMTVNWKLVSSPVNSRLLEPGRQPDGTFAAEFEVAGDFAGNGWQIVFADDIGALIFNDQTVPLEPSEEGSVASLPPGRPGLNTVSFRPVKTVERPFVWVKGLFRVQNGSAYEAGPEGTVRTAGPFCLHSGRDLIEPDLIADGFPFLQTTLAVNAEIELPGAVAGLRLDGLEADAVRLTVDGCDYGWMWRLDSGLVFHIGLAAGRHQMMLELAPSTFNGFGPHHYYAGDWHGISPAQFQGVRNFADAPDAPVRTHVAAWHFRPFRLPDAMTFL